MKTTFRESFARDLKQIKNQRLLDRIRKAIEEVESASALSELRQLKKLAGGSNAYRIRVGDHRIGVTASSDTVDFVRCLPRRDLYRHFP